LRRFYDEPERELNVVRRGAYDDDIQDPSTTTTSTSATDESTASPSTSTQLPSQTSAPPAAPEEPGSYDHSTDADFCRTHQCIKNFPNGNGYIVQCQDGEWSHSGGVSGACSDHRGEAGGQGPTASAPVTTTSTPPATSAPYGNSLPVQCFTNSSNGDFLSASAGNTCTFANNTFYEYYQASGGDPTQAESIRVWSVQDQKYYSLSCSAGDGVVDCTSGNGGDVRFSVHAITVYDSSQAATYARKGTLGPSG
jgi:hypothetical protein